MTIRDEISKVDRYILDTEIRLRTTQVSLGSLDQEITLLNYYCAELEENLRRLKQSNVIAIASEYKKTKESLATIHTNLIKTKNSRQEMQKAYALTEMLLERARAHYGKLLNKQENVVVIGNFGGKSGTK